MNLSKYFHVIFFVVLVSVVAAGCVSGGRNGGQSHASASAFEALDPQERDQLQSLQAQASQRALSRDEATLVQTSDSMTVAEYLSKYGRAAGPGDYTVGGNDILSIHVYDQAELTREAVPVSADGSISFPFIGQIRVAGLTTAQVETTIAQSLRDGGFLVDPQISVVVAEYKSKTALVLGAVETPGRYQLEAQETILDVLSKAEGVSTKEGGKGGNLNRATLVRAIDGPGGAKRKVGIELNLRNLLSGQEHQANLVLQDGDVLYVPMADKVYVMGEVMKPGAFIMEDKDMTIVEAIGMAGGFTRLAAPNRTSVVRKTGAGEQIFQVSVEDITERGGGGFLVQPNDIVIVPESYF